MINRLYDTRKEIGSSLQGYITTTLERLIYLFGEPDEGSDKTNAEWILDIDGTIVTIYDYKQSEAPTGKYDWHIGGFSPKAVEKLGEFTGLPCRTW